MNSIYTTTITDEAKKRGIKIEVLDSRMPVFVLKKGGKAVRCFNALTDNVGAASFVMAQNKGAANSFLRKHGIPVVVQKAYETLDKAKRFLVRHKCIVVKPATQWGGRGVSVAVRTIAELKQAIQMARRYEEDVLLEECVQGEDFRLILVNYKFVAAIKRSPAVVVGDGRSSILVLIRKFNKAEKKTDPSHQIPVDHETERALACGGMNHRTVPAKGQVVRVRLNSNYHTGGVVDVVTSIVDQRLIAAAGRVARLTGIPVIGVDFLYDRASGRYRVIELSPDLAISPPEGQEVAGRFLDYLFSDIRG